MSNLHFESTEVMLKLRVSGWPRLKGGWDCQPLPFRLPPHILSFNITYSNVQPLIAILCVRLGWVCVCVHSQLLYGSTGLHLQRCVVVYNALESVCVGGDAPHTNGFFWQATKRELSCLSLLAFVPHISTNLPYCLNFPVSLENLSTCQ